MSLESVIKTWGGSEASAYDVYSDMYQFGEGYIQKENEPSGSFKANPVAYWRTKGKKKGHYRIVFEDTFEQLLPELQAADFCIMNGISYFGRKNEQDHSSKMFAMIFDLDGVTDQTLNNFFNGAFEGDAYPVPNYVILSGHGVHLYYLFERPIPLFPNIKIQLKSFKYALTERLWNNYTSVFKKKQIQGINQGFRVIGGKTKEGAGMPVVRAFRLNTHPFNLDQLGQYVPAENRVAEDKLFRESKMTLAEAKAKFPDWYERVVIGKNKMPSRWRIEEKVNGDNPYALYDWWKNRIREGAAYNHRYFCIMCLVIYGVKCNVPYDQVREDSYSFVPFLNSINPSEPFTESDVDSALECYDLRYATFPLKDIEIISNIQIKRNKRNGRKQQDHIKLMNYIRDELNGNKNWRDGNGRKSAEAIIRKYLDEHPDCRKADVIRDLKLSKPTVYKWWGVIKDGKKIEPEMVSFQPTPQEIAALLTSSLASGNQVFLYADDPDLVQKFQNAVSSGASDVKVLKKTEMQKRFEVYQKEIEKNKQEG